jgi:hypothetical protein
MNGWTESNLLNPGPTTTGAVSISGVVTNQPLGQSTRLKAGGATRGLVVKLKASGVTVVGAITAKLQTAIGSDWVDSKTVTISANGDFYIKLNNAASADQTYFPLLAQARVVVTTTNAGDAATITEVDLLQEF